MPAEELALHKKVSSPYDKTGVCASILNCRNYANITLTAFVKDTILLIVRFKNEESFSKIIILGHSEGSL